MEKNLFKIIDVSDTFQVRSYDLPVVNSVKGYAEDLGLKGIKYIGVDSSDEEAIRNQWKNLLDVQSYYLNSNISRNMHCLKETSLGAIVEVLETVYYRASMRILCDLKQYNIISFIKGMYYGMPNVKTRVSSNFTLSGTLRSLIANEIVEGRNWAMFAKLSVEDSLLCALNEINEYLLKSNYTLRTILEFSMYRHDRVAVDTALGIKVLMILGAQPIEGYKPRYYSGDRVVIDKIMEYIHSLYKNRMYLHNFEVGDLKMLKLLLTGLQAGYTTRENDWAEWRAKEQLGKFKKNVPITVL